MANNTLSTYFFIGKIHDRLARYQVQRKPIGDNLFFEVFLDGITVWGLTEKNFDIFYPEVKEIFNTIISAYIFKTNKPIIYTLENWIETKDVNALTNQVGWIYSQSTSLTPLPESSKLNTPWKKAIWFYKNQNKGNENHIIALKDYRIALTDTGDDAFLFAFRAIEDICRAVSGQSDTEASSWTKMHETLGTSLSKIKPLKDVADKVRHGDLLNPLVISARKNRKDLLQISHEILNLEFKRTFPNYL